MTREADVAGRPSALAVYQLTRGSVGDATTGRLRTSLWWWFVEVAVVSMRRQVASAVCAGVAVVTCADGCANRIASRAVPGTSSAVSSGTIPWINAAAVPFQAVVPSPRPSPRRPRVHAVQMTSRPTSAEKAVPVGT